METTRLLELPIIPEKYGKEFAPVFHDTDMTRDERLFISGLIKYYKPKNILEIGVAGGGGSANILNTIQDMDDTILTSIDVVKVFEHPFVGPLEIGKFVYQSFPDLPDGKWQLLLGKDPSERMEDLNMAFDFLILDTMHVHPVETLNFLSVLPYLRENAIVILHDITIYMDVLFRTNNMNCFATRLLMSSVCADKLLPEFTGFSGFTNIVAFQISPDTRKYLRNLFDSLMLPWEYLPDTIDSVGNFINRHYSDELKKIFWMSVELNLKVYIEKKGKLPEILLSKLKKDKPIFYGAGNNMKKILSLVGDEDKFDLPIWDEKADTIKEICGCAVIKPDFVSYDKTNRKVIVSIENKETFDVVYQRLEPLGYVIFRGLYAYLRSLLDDE